MEGERRAVEVDAKAVIEESRALAGEWSAAADVALGGEPEVHRFDVAAVRKRLKKKPPSVEVYGVGTMAKLSITVDWLEERYHGVEWPPSPWRLYQAMMAGSAMGWCRDPELEAALRHLETLSAPVVTAPRAASLRAVRAPVPDNAELLTSGTRTV